MDKSNNKMIYLDNNATTIMPAEVLKAMLEWSNRGNASASYASAREARGMMMKFRNHIARVCGFDACCEEPRDTDKKSDLAKRQEDPSRYKILFTSCASEANATIIQAVVDSYAEAVKSVPHIVTSAIEHKSVLDHIKYLEEHGKVEATYVRPTTSGHILAQDVAAAIRPNTCLVCIIHANNETGAINDVREIGRIAHARQVPFHTDTVQSFGKFPLNPIRSNVDSFCVSFHKLQGPPGVGALIVKQQFLAGYKLRPLIFGSQNEGLRGGTENLPGIGAAFEAFQLSMTNRETKNARIGKIKSYIVEELGKRLPALQYEKYVEEARTKGPKRELELVWLSGNSRHYLPGTILLSIVKRGGGKPVCNARMKSELEARGIVVSVGSACNTASAKASHVLYALDADELIRKGALRISIGDMNTMDDAKAFVREFLQVLKGEISCS